MDIPGLARFFETDGGNRKHFTTPLKRLEMKTIQTNVFHDSQPFQR